MAVKYLEVEEIGTIRLQRRKGVKNISLRVSSSGEIRVSAPWMIPRSVITGFIQSKQDWIKQQKTNSAHVWLSGQYITPQLELKLEPTSNKRASKINNNSKLVCFLPHSYSTEQKESYIEKSVTAVQKSYCESILFGRAKDMSITSGLDYKKLSCKPLKSRWGSCDSNKKITLNVFLSSLELELVDYVIAHELAHTIHLNHGADFWHKVSELEPDYKRLRKLLRKIQPAPRPYPVSVA